jgi:hypothetical protein
MSALARLPTIELTRWTVGDETVPGAYVRCSSCHAFHMLTLKGNQGRPTVIKLAEELGWAFDDDDRARCPGCRST